MALRVFIAALFLAFLPALAGAVPRSIAITARDGASVMLYSASYALVVGISDYIHWPKLPGVMSDIPAVKTALEAQGFQVTTLIDPDRNQLEQAFRTFIRQHGQHPDNRLLFYFAGHGHSLKASYGDMMGYLVPRDAPDPNLDRAGFMDTAMSMETVEVYAKRIQSKHAMFVFDSCFSGTIFNSDRAIPDDIREKTSKPVRMFITAGTADQTVPDESIFRRQFVVGLDGEADRDKDGYVTGTELGLFLDKTVTNYTRRKQTPRYGKISNRFLDKGDFVFKLARTQTAAAAPKAPLGAAPPPQRQFVVDKEIVFWQSIEDSDDAAMYQAYLSTYPDGSFVAIAKIKLAALLTAPHPAVPKAVPAAPAATPDPAPKTVPELVLVGAPYIALKNANVRASPDTTSRRLATLYAGSEVYVSGRTQDGRWLQVQQAGRGIGFVYASLLQDKRAYQGARVAASARQTALQRPPVQPARPRPSVALQRPVQPVQPRPSVALQRPVQPVQPRPPAAPVTQCDRLAASPDDPSAVSAGVSSQVLARSANAVAVCRKALQQFPGVARLQFQLARALNTAGQDREAVDLYRQAAEQGYGAAQADLGALYARGSGVRRNHREAVKWFQAAADQGLTQAQYGLALMLEKGLGIKRDYAQAARRYRLAAERGFAPAMTGLGYLYFTGRGVRRDYPSAAQNYQRAASRGHAVAQYLLADMFEKGLGVQRSRDEALKWYEKAASQGYRPAQTSLRRLSR